MKAFPSISKEPMDDGNGCFYTPSSEGMDLRDYFAAKALNAFLLKLTEDYVMSDVASDCYTVADEMMEARK